MEGKMDFDSLMDLIRRRRSYWHFRSDPVSDDLVEKVIDAARYAPSAFNSQPWEFVVIRDAALRAEIVKVMAENLPGLPPQLPTVSGAPTAKGPAKDPLGFRTAPVLILVLGDTRVRPFGPPYVREDDDRWQPIFTSSLAAAYEHMHLAAASLGLATRWVSAVVEPLIAARIKELLDIPKGLEVFEMMALGYSDFEPLPKKMRPLSEVMHLDACGEKDFRTAEQVCEYFTGPPA
jgi:nitroreductase